MADLNWAREELERDVEGWRKRASLIGAQAARQRGTPDETGGGDAGGRAASKRAEGGPMVKVEPQVLTLPGRRGSAASFAAACPGLSPSAVRARFKPGCISVDRLPPSGEQALFRVIVTEEFTSDIWDNAIETVEVIAAGFTTNKVFVSVASVTPSIVSQEYGRRIAPPRHASHTARISFGKHRGRIFQEVAIEEPGYLEWMLREGAGSRVERGSARLALDFVRGGGRLRPSGRRADVPLKAKDEAPTIGALPDPHRPGGLLNTLKALFRPKRRPP